MSVFVTLPTDRKAMKIRLQLSKPTSEEYLMIGISSSWKDYQLSYYLNKHFQTLFLKQADIPFYNRQGLIGTFPFYYFHNDDLRMDYYLFANKNEQSIAIPNYRHFEYFLLFKLSSYLIPITDILKELRQIAGISAALQIPLITLKNLPEILEDIELHLLDISSSIQRRQTEKWLW